MQRQVKVLSMPLTFILVDSNKSDEEIRKEFLQKYRTFSKDSTSKESQKNQKKYL